MACRLTDSFTFYQKLLKEEEEDINKLMIKLEKCQKLKGHNNNGVKLSVITTLISDDSSLRKGWTEIWRKGYVHTDN